MNSDVVVLTSAHWAGDPRLNRHILYLTQAGISAEVYSSAKEGRRRFWNLATAIAYLWRARPRSVILVDPDLFVLGSLVARVRGSQSIIDIHENYASVLVARRWIPSWIRPVLRPAIQINDRIARRLADKVIVAAGELLYEDAIMIPNIPDPAGFTIGASSGTTQTVVYVGDITEARGAQEMADLARRIPTIRFLIIGRVDDDLRRDMQRRAGPDSNLELPGRLPHSEAWTLARGSIAGLSMLRDLPAYAEATATKLWEYCASGIPPVVSALPAQKRFVEGIDSELACKSTDDFERLIRRLSRDESWRAELSSRSRKLVEEAWQLTRPDQVLPKVVQP